MIQGSVPAWSRWLSLFHIRRWRWCFNVQWRDMLPWSVPGSVSPSVFLRGMVLHRYRLRWCRAKRRCIPKFFIFSRFVPRLGLTTNLMPKDSVMPLGTAKQKGFLVKRMDQMAQYGISPGCLSFCGTFEALDWSNCRRLIASVEPFKSRCSCQLLAKANNQMGFAFCAKTV